MFAPENQLLPIRNDDMRRNKPYILTTTLFFLVGCGLINALLEGSTPPRRANADVLQVRAVQTDAELWTFYATVAHPDTGWDDYADGWDVVLPDGTVSKPDPNSPFTRLLLHPHETEQPFTRSQSGIRIPADVTEVRVRAHDLVDGWGGQEVVVNLTASSGENFTVERSS